MILIANYRFLISHHRNSLILVPIHAENLIVTLTPNGVIVSVVYIPHSSHVHHLLYNLVKSVRVIMAHVPGNVIPLRLGCDSVAIRQLKKGFFEPLVSNYLAVSVSKILVKILTLSKLRKMKMHWKHILKCFLAQLWLII